MSTQLTLFEIPTDTLKIKSPLRYPGGKSKAAPLLIKYFPTSFDEYREPMIGGGSVFAAVHSLYQSSINYWINDLNYDLVCLWKSAQCNINELVSKVKLIKSNSDDGRKLFEGIDDAVGVPA